MIHNYLCVITARLTEPRTGPHFGKLNHGQGQKVWYALSERPNS
jgi:hypothetical protein